MPISLKIWRQRSTNERHVNFFQKYLKFEQKGRGKVRTQRISNAKHLVQKNIRIDIKMGKCGCKQTTAQMKEPTVNRFHSYLQHGHISS